MASSPAILPGLRNNALYTIIAKPGSPLILLSWVGAETYGVRIRFKFPHGVETHKAGYENGDVHDAAHGFEYGEGACLRRHRHHVAITQRGHSHEAVKDAIEPVHRMVWISS